MFEVGEDGGEWFGNVLWEKPVLGGGENSICGDRIRARQILNSEDETEQRGG